MKRVILNADDFGLAPAINAAVVHAAADGALTSASISVNGPCAAEAARLARTVPHLDLGLHLTLVDEFPAAAPERIPSLVDASGRLPRSGLALARRWCGGALRGNDLEREIAAQWDRAEALGLRLSHFDSHDHVHVLPGLLELCLRQASAHGVRRLRVPLEKRPVGAASALRRLYGGGLAALARRAAGVARRRGFAFPHAYSGFRGAGAIDADSLVERIASASDGTTEIGLHPAIATPPRPDMAGWGYRWEAEFAALMSSRVQRALAPAGITAGSYRDLEPTRQRAA